MAVALVLLIASVAAACPTCKEGLAQNDPHGQSIAAGYYYSILFMMSMPFASSARSAAWPISRSAAHADSSKPQIRRRMRAV